MADDRDDPRLFLIDPDIRGILPLDGLHISRSLKKTVRRDVFKVTVDRAFAQVLEQCAASRPGRENTWINAPIFNLYCNLHRQGHAHSVECWQDDQLVGGLYGVSLQGAFFGESMFSTRSDASKVALVHLVARLRVGGYKLLDTQFLTDHLASLGAEETMREDFHVLLARALETDANFFALSPPGQSVYGADVMQLMTQTS